MDEKLKQPAQDVINLLLTSQHRTSGLNYSDYVKKVGDKYNIQDGHRAIKEYLLKMGIIKMNRPIGDEENGKIMHYKYGLEKYKDNGFIEHINDLERKESGHKQQVEQKERKRIGYK